MKKLSIVVCLVLTLTLIFAPMAMATDPYETTINGWFYGLVAGTPTGLWVEATNDAGAVVEYYAKNLDTNESYYFGTDPDFVFEQEDAGYEYDVYALVTFSDSYVKRVPIVSGMLFICIVPN